MPKANRYISALLQSREVGFAQRYNLRNQRSAAFWQDRYHATPVEGGSICGGA